MANNSEDADNAYHLLRLLEMHCQSQDDWEEHYDELFDGKFNKKKEEASQKVLLEESTRPLLKKITLAGFKFADIIDIIPGNFATTGSDREDILAVLRVHVDQNYDLEIPF